MNGQSAAKLYGKNKDLILVGKRSEQKKSYKKYIYTLKCINCNHEFDVYQQHGKRAICLKCRSKEVAESYVGKSIGEFTILNYSYSKKGLNFYNCSCNTCSTLHTTNIQAIKEGRKCPNCRVRGKKPTYESQMNYLKNQYVQGAKDRKLEWNLSDEEFYELVTSKCFYSGTEPQHRNPSGLRTFLEFKVNGIDRVDSSKGYTRENCVSCCERCNRMKMSLNKDDFLFQISKIYKYYIEGSTTIPKGSTTKWSEKGDNFTS